ncbi:MAG: nitrilase-related carbon-nitrogen hydrolase, partial [Candidatus Cloacimonas sp.]|nr:nitrilase-related carbon-nitrogen hydrolase [Candidatus Cloacimonas sp.]
MKVSVVQFSPIFLAVQENLDRLLSMLESVDSDLVVLPELVTSGYVFSSLEEVVQVAESVPDGFAFKAFSALAKRKNCSIVYGFPEKADRQANFGRTQCAPTAFQPSNLPSLQPSIPPTFQPSNLPSLQPSNLPSLQPSIPPTFQP